MKLPYGDGLDNYHDRPSDFLYSYSKEMNERLVSDPAIAGSYHQRFQAVLDFVERNFPLGFRKTERSKATPRARFESIAIGVDRALAERPDLTDRSAAELNVAAWIDSVEFKTITSSDGANAKARLQGRIDFVKDKLVGHDRD